jgi:predicted nucleic acid-binding protein
LIYLDSSALIKHYVQEIGTERVREKLGAGNPVFTSVLAFAEIHSALARRFKDKSISPNEFVAARSKFDLDWAVSWGAVDLTASVLSIVRNIVDQFALRGADAVHLASAIWLRDTATAGKIGSQLLFLSSDKQLAKAAADFGLEAFNPQTAP